MISDRKCQDRSSSRIEFFIAQTAFEFIGHAGNDTLAEAPASFFINAVKTPYPIVLDRQFYLRTVSLKHNSDWPRFFRVSVLQRVKDKLRSHNPNRDGRVWPRLNLIADKRYAALMVTAA